MARNFVRASSQYIENATDSGITAYPVTIAGWARSTDNTVNQSVLCLSKNSGSPNAFLAVSMDGTASDTVKAFASFGSQQNAVTSGSWTSGTWHHIGGVFGSSTSRFAYLDGTASTESTASDGGASLSALTHTTVGALDLGSFFNHVQGDIGQMAIWNIALSSAKMSELAAGYTPFQVEPTGLLRWWDLIGGLLVDRMTGSVFTSSGSTAATSHPPIIMPRRPYMVSKTAFVPSVTGNPYYYYAQQ